MKVEVLTAPDERVKKIYASRNADIDIVPDYFFIIPDIAVEGLFVSKNGECGFPHGFYTDPSAEKETRGLAIDLIITSMIQFCMYHKIRCMVSAAKKGKFLQRFLDQGFIAEEGEWVSAGIKL